MKTKLFLILFFCACASLLKADLLYWQISSPADVHNNYYDTTSTESTYAFAMIYSMTANDATGGTALQSYAGDGTTQYYGLTAGSKGAADVGSDYSGKNFYIVLYNNSGTEVAHSNTMSGDWLSGQAFISAAEFNANWNGMTLTNAQVTFVPEPTGALLMLIGAAFLGLRRKRVA